MKLAKAASQPLKGVIVEYDVICRSLLSSSLDNITPNQAHLNEMNEKVTQNTSFMGSFIQKVFKNDYPNLPTKQHIADIKQIVSEDRLQHTLQGLPTKILNRIDNFSQTPSSTKDMIEQYRNDNSVQSNVKATLKSKDFGSQASSMAASNNNSVRSKYMDKLNALKAKVQSTRSTDPSPLATSEKETKLRDSTVSSLLNNELTVKGLSTWLVNKGANEMLDFITKRGLMSAAIPPFSTFQDAEFEEFIKQTEGFFDTFMSKEQQIELPSPQSILALCKTLELSPNDVLVIGIDKRTIRAAKDAGTHCCHYRPDKSMIPNHTAHFHLANLRDFQLIVEEFNGVSYRGRTFETHF